MPSSFHSQGGHSKIHIKFHDFSRFFVDFFMTFLGRIVVARRRRGKFFGFTQTKTCKLVVFAIILTTGKLNFMTFSGCFAKIS